MSEPLVCVVVVTFESRDDISECLRSVLASDVPVELIVIDNHSRDGTVERVAEIIAQRPQCRLMRNEHNVGFAKAVNQGIAASRAPFVLTLNPDAVVLPDTIGIALRALEARPKAALAGCMLLNPDGTEQAGARRYLPTPWRALVRVLQLYRLDALHPRLHGFHMNQEPVPRGPIEVEATSGAFMLVRRCAIEQVGTLDEGYFMHCEDLDWCVRFRQAGWTVLFVPNAKAAHRKGGSSRARPIRVELYKHRGMVRFYRKFFRRRYPSVLMWAVVAAVWTRFAIKAVWMALTGAGRAASPTSETRIRDAGRYVE
jgi:GT2 family glycosyltransferase